MTVASVNHLSSEDVSAEARGLRVLFVIDSRFPNLGGAESQALKLANGLRDAGVYVDFVAPQVDPGTAASDTVDGFKLTRIVYPHIKLLGTVYLLLSFSLFLIRNRKNYNYMHIHITRLLTATAGMLRPLVKIPIVTKISGFFEFEGGILDPRKRFNPLNVLLLFAMRNVDHVQTISVETEEKLIASGFRPDQISLIPNGIDVSEAPAPAPENDVYTIGYCGRLRDVKGVHVLFDAFAQCKAVLADEPMKLLIAGSGSAESELKAQAERLGITQDIEFLGLVADVSGFYKQLDIYVQPSFAEGLPNSVLEAMHAGRPVLATDIGGNRDLVEEDVTGHLFEAGDHNALAELLVKCIQHQDVVTAMGLNGRAVIDEHFAMESVVNQLIEVYSAE
jgi:glycosyltransferase involved in cell wall biosynthesis